MPSIEDYGGIEEYLRQTKRLHHGWDGPKLWANQDRPRPLTQQEIADAAGVKRSTITDWELRLGINRYKVREEKS